MINLATIWPKRPVLAAAGFVVSLIGAVLLVLPGPGLILLALGLSILGSEYLWARKVMRSVRRSLQLRGL